MSIDLKLNIRNDLMQRCLGDTIPLPTSTLQVEEMIDYIVHGELKDTAALRLGKYISGIWRWNDIAEVEPNENAVELYSKLITEEYTEFKEAWDSKDVVEQADACVDLVWVIIGFLRASGYNNLTVDQLFAEVQRSNYSKFFRNEEGALTCKKREDGKIIKPEGYSKPDLKSIVEKS